jgi:hypothetical protein
MEQSPKRRNPVVRALTLTLILLTLALAAAARAETAVFSWAPSSTVGAGGETLPPAVAYEVWVMVNFQPEARVATVRDTFYALQAEAGNFYRMRVRGLSAEGAASVMSEYSELFLARALPSAVPDAATAALGSIFPNPFNPATEITYSLPDDLPSSVPLSLAIYDMRGRRVVAFDLDRSAGEGRVTWRGTDASGQAAPAGVYLAKFVCGDHLETKKLTLVR